MFCLCIKLPIELPLTVKMYVPGLQCSFDEHIGYLANLVPNRFLSLPKLCRRFVMRSLIKPTSAAS